MVDLTAPESKRGRRGQRAWGGVLARGRRDITNRGFWAGLGAKDRLPPQEGPGSDRRRHWKAPLARDDGELRKPPEASSHDAESLSFLENSAAHDPILPKGGSEPGPAGAATSGCPG